MNRYKQPKSIILIVIFSFLYFSNTYSEQYNLAIGAIFRNEKPYLKEWIEFHRLLGVEYFYLYNNLSTDLPEEVLKPYIEEGIVELIDWPFQFTNANEWKKIQTGAYNEILKLAEGEAKWVAFIDLDEFLFSVEENTLTEALKDFESYGGVAVNWQSFGTSNVKKIPDDKLLIETLIYKAPFSHSRSQLVKSIVQPKYTQEFMNAHKAKFKSGFFCVKTNQKPFTKGSTPLINKMRINHYWTRDEDYFYKSKLISREKREKKGNYRIAKISNQIIDTVILRFVPELKKNLDSQKNFSRNEEINLEKKSSAYLVGRPRISVF
jgi:hypothetical protein